MASFLTAMLFALTGLQGFIMLFDEFIFHRQRGLGTFERWGHVADTGLFTLALLVPALAQPTEWTLGLYAFLALASCLMITKDEWIHATSCQGPEQWCHALLFILHGPILLAAGLVWWLEPNLPLFRWMPLITGSWGFYQYFYWNVYHDAKHKPARREQSVLR